MAKVKKAFNTEEVQATIKQLVRQTLREALEAGQLSRELCLEF